jgi:hypothetical protein
MILPPLIIDVHVKEKGSRGFRIWLPFFLLWPLFFPLVALVLLVTRLVDFLLLLAGSRYHHYTALFVGVLRLCAEVRGTKADIVDSKRTRVHVAII